MDKSKRKKVSTKVITDGGTYVARDVQAEGDFIGRDKVEGDKVEVNISISPSTIESLLGHHQRLENESPRLLTDEGTTYTNDWVKYVENIAQLYENWYLSPGSPASIQYKTEPVEVEEYFRVKLISPTSHLYKQPSKQNTQASNGRLLSLQEVIQWRTAIILGSAGAGKTTVLRYLMYRLANTAVKDMKNYVTPNTLQIPFFVSLRQYGSSNLFALMLAQLRQCGLNITDNGLKQMLDTVLPFFLLDGFDEVKPDYRDELENEISVLSQNYPRSTILLTSRKRPSPNLYFPIFETQPLQESSVLLFAKSYLDHNKRYAFRYFIEQNQLEDFILTPLLLVFCLILYREDASTLLNIADIYVKIISLYESQWEERNKSRRFTSPIDWIILERSASLLAYIMVSTDLGYSISREEALGFLSRQIEDFRTQNLWSEIKNTAFDILEQLLVHNFLEVLDDDIHFWHPSFRDFFAARHLARQEYDNLLPLISTINAPWVMAFLCGLIDTPRPLVDHLIKNINSGNQPLALQAIEALSKMGNEFTLDIVRSVSKPSFAELHFAAYEILEGRDFAGRKVCLNALQQLFILDQLYNGWISYEDVEESFPSPDTIDLRVFNGLYNMIMQEIVAQNIDAAEQQYRNLIRYLEQLRIDEDQYDTWLVSRGIPDFDTFIEVFETRTFDYGELIAFCNHTTNLSSIPILEHIYYRSENFDLIRAAGLAIQCIIRK